MKKRRTARKYLKPLGDWLSRGGETRRRLVFAGTVAVAGAAVSAALFALSGNLPEPTTSGYPASIVIGRLANGNTLPSGEASVKLIYNARPDWVDVIDGPYCNDSQYDHQKASTTAPCDVHNPASDVVFEFQALNNDTGAVGPVIPVLASTMAANGGVNGAYRVNLGGLQGVAPSTDGRWFVKVRVRWFTPNDPSCVPTSPLSNICRTGSNFFRFVMPRASDLATYAVLNGDPFPLTVEADGPNAPRHSDLEFQFAPPCTAVPGQSYVQPLRWQDADYDQSNQEGDISWELIDETTSQLIATMSNGQLGGQGVVGQYPAAGGGITFEPGHKYRWIWRHVDQNNGVQIFFPFDPYNYARPCSAVSIRKSSSATTNLTPGTRFDYYLNVTRSGPQLSSLTINDTLPGQVTYVADPAANVPAPAAVNGQALTWTFGPGSPEINAINSTGSILIRFRVSVNLAAPVGLVTNTATGSAVNVSGQPVPVSPGISNDRIVAPDMTTKPYFSVRNGDVIAGTGMAVRGGDCPVPTNPLGGIVGWNRGSAGNFGGAGTQYGGFAFGRIQEFATAQGSAMAPSGLAFANNADGQLLVAGGLYGGKFNGGPCAKDYMGESAPGQVQNGDVPLQAMTIPNCNGTNAAQCQRTIYIRGNAYINGDIRFSGTYAGVQQIPTFRLVVEGDIFIAPGVQRLDGVYVAQPASGSAENGNIYTCAPGSTPPYARAGLDIGLADTCRTPLTVNGSFIGRRIWLLRTAGAVSENVPSETFNYAPEVWLSGAGGGLGDGYDSITSLPPVL